MGESGNHGKAIHTRFAQLQKTSGVPNQPVLSSPFGSSRSGHDSDETVRAPACSLSASGDAGESRSRRRDVHATRTDRGGGGRGAIEPLLCWERLTYCPLRFGMGGLGARMGGGPTAGREVDAGLQL